MLKTIDLVKQYGSHTALQGLNLTVEPGEVFCLLGANGAGKSTTINLFLNFIAPTSGQVFVNGFDVTKYSQETKQFLGYIPEQVMLYKDLTGLENLEYFSSLSRRRRPPREELKELLFRVHLAEDAWNRRVGTYSKGMRQKVAIAIALSKDARAFLLDEPTSGLDPKASNEFSALVNQLKENRMAILMATHDLFRAKESGTRLGIMKHGQLVETLRTENIGHADLEQLYLRHMHD
ncbi:MAG TPA: ABC transporter ATP-binding protein [Planctomicrobium sp.]|nr:ABC transporter ATP-binding protein [Planctomicrobium sp.]